MRKTYILGCVIAAVAYRGAYKRDEIDTREFLEYVFSWPLTLLMGAQYLTYASVFTILHRHMVLNEKGCYAGLDEERYKFLVEAGGYDYAKTKRAKNKS